MNDFENVAARVTKSVAHKVTSQRPEEFNRHLAWMHLLTPQGRDNDASTGALARDAGVLTPATTLSEVSTKYDLVLHRLKYRKFDEVSETDLLASLLVMRTLRAKLLRDESQILAAARRKKITWARLAAAMEVKNRQSAERRALQLDTQLDDEAGDRLTQSERVDVARSRRDRRTERLWATQHQHEIVALARRVTAVPDLQQRADNSPYAQALNTKAGWAAHEDGRPAPPPAQPAWPQQLREALAAEEDHQQAAPHHTPARPRPGYLTDIQRADLLYRLFGFIGHAADPYYADLGHWPELLIDARPLCDQAGRDTPAHRLPRTRPTTRSTKDLH